MSYGTTAKSPLARRHGNRSILISSFLVEDYERVLE